MIEYSTQITYVAHHAKLRFGQRHENENKQNAEKSDRFHIDEILKAGERVWRDSGGATHSTTRAASNRNDDRANAAASTLASALIRPIVTGERGGG